MYALATYRHVMGPELNMIVVVLVIKLKLSKIAGQ